MRFAYTKLFILVTLLLVSGCSREAPDNYQGKNVVRKAIKKPAVKINDREESRKEITKIVEKDIADRINKETVKEQAPPEQDKNIYITKGGETLLDISGKANIYNNPLKWPFLYRDNAEILSSIKDKDDLYEAGLPAGLRLKIIPQQEIKKTLEKRPPYYFTVNVMSSPYMKEIAPQIVKLIDEGYYAYLSSAVVDGRQWYRLRTGFYKTSSEASSAGDKIITYLNISDIWTVKIGDEEFHDFGGY